MDDYLIGKLIIAKAIKASPHNASFSFVSLIFNLSSLLIINKFFIIIKFTEEAKKSFKDFSD